jgi:hypothetical protein
MPATAQVNHNKLWIGSQEFEKLLATAEPTFSSVLHLGLMRATSLIPISWISAGVSLVVVNFRAKKAYILSPYGICQAPTLSKHAGRYSSAKNCFKCLNAGMTFAPIVSLALLLSLIRSGSAIDFGVVE